MRTARSLPYRGISLTETLPDRDPPGQRNPPWTETPPSHVTCGGCWDRDRHGQNSWHTLVKTLPCRNFVAGGNNANVIILQLQKWNVGWPKEGYDLDSLYHLHLHIVKEDKWYAGVDLQGGSIFLRWPQTQKGAPAYPLINLPKKLKYL